MRFRGQAGGNFIERMGFVALEQIVDGAFASVVGSQGKTPIVEMAMEVLEIFGGGESAFVGG